MLQPRVPVRVAVINDYEIVVRGVAAMLEDTERVHVIELDADLPTAQPVDIALYDTFSARQAGADDVDEVLGNPLVDKVVIFTWNLQPELVAKAQAQGVHGYVSKGAARHELIDALLRVHAGECVFPNNHEVIEDANLPHPGHEAGLTMREAEVIGLITQGLSNAEIAERAFLSINSVKSYIRSAYRKMGVQRRSQAVIWGMAHGFTTRPRRWVRQP
ncbi:response regulator transcription factor [Propioniciclava soli]|uniref:Response regulator transcription factor n=1 Tax=Propioniciclava soli TaxID=2775081 RepID=A0ABZ3C5X2_9ACTN